MKLYYSPGQALESIDDTRICFFVTLLLYPRYAIPNDTARTGWYVPVRQQTCTRIARYRVVVSIEALSSTVTEGEERRGRRGRNK